MIVFIGIMDLFNALPHNDLYNALNGRMWNTQGPQTAVFPYAVFNLVSNIPDYTFSTEFEDYVIGFNLFSNTESDTEINTLFTYLTDLYDRASLNVPGFRSVNMQRESANLIRDADLNVWQANVLYRVLLEKNL